MRWVEQALLGKLPDRLHRRLRRHLRSDAGLQAYYDRSVEAIRFIEGDVDYAPCELDTVGSWLADDLQPSSAPGRGWLAVRLLVPALGVAALALALAPLWPWLGSEDVEFAARGDAADQDLALEALCTPASADGGAEMRPVGVGPCPVDGVLGLAYWTDGAIADSGARWLSLFGVDEAGRLLYYAPTPVDPAAIPVESGGWHSVPRAVELSVNHQPGRIWLYGLVSDAAPAVEQLERWSALLPDDNDDPRDPPWHERLGSSEMGAVCPNTADCDSAELTFVLVGDES